MSQGPCAQELSLIHILDLRTFEAGGLQVVGLGLERLAVELDAAAVDETSCVGNALRRTGVHQQLGEVHGAVLARGEVGLERGRVLRETVVLELKVEVGFRLLGRSLIMIGCDDVAGQCALDLVGMQLVCLQIGLELIDFGDGQRRCQAIVLDLSLIHI